MTFKTQIINPSIKHEGHPVNVNARKIFHFLQSKKASKAKKISLETQLEIANLKYENEELTKKNAKLTNTLKLKSQQLLNYSLRLRGAHVLITKLRKQILDKDSIYNGKFSLEDTFCRSISSKNNKYLESKY